LDLRPPRGGEISLEHGDPGRLLTAVLQGVEAEVGEVGHRLIGGQNGEHTAGLFRLVGTLVAERQGYGQTWGGK
jgi:hypothetical protein